MAIQQMCTRLFIFSFALLIAGASARCYDPSPAFPLPELLPGAKYLNRVFALIEDSVKSAVSDETFATSSFSIEVTSSKETLWSTHHTAKERNESRLGVPVVDGDSVYRIASITKVFTTLGILQQHAAGNLSLDDPISNYITELNEPQEGSIPWRDITIRTLASQLSGIPREFAHSDLINELEDPSIIGLPPMSRKGLLRCDEYGGHVPCNRTGNAASPAFSSCHSMLMMDLCTAFLDSIRAKRPLFAPNQKSTYSNVAFELLGLALENSTGLSYSQYITDSIIKTLGMNNTSLDKPSDAVAVLPKGDNYWDIEEGVQRPTGGVYSSSSDLSCYLRYILTHYNAITPALNWLHPASYSTGINSFYGIPWEIFRTTKLLPNTNRPVTFVTKSGGLPGYHSIIIMAPDYDLGVTILVGGNGRLLGRLRELVTVPLIRGVEYLVTLEMRAKYDGTFVSSKPDLNSSLTLSAHPDSGLTITKFISNGTDVLASPLPAFSDPETATRHWRAQVIPTLLYRNETALQGEIWRMMVVLYRLEEEEEVWDEFCSTDVDQASYAELPINELVFYTGDDDAVFEVELPAFRVRLQREPESGGRVGGADLLGGLDVQG